MFLNKFYEKWNNYSKVRWSYIISDVAQNSHSLKNVWRHVDGVLRGPVFALCAFAYPPPTALFCSPSHTHTHTHVDHGERDENEMRTVMEELSAVGEQVFDAECILNKRIKKVTNIHTNTHIQRAWIVIRPQRVFDFHRENWSIWSSGEDGRPSKWELRQILAFLCVWEYICRLCMHYSTLLMPHYFTHGACKHHWMWIARKGREREKQWKQQQQRVARLISRPRVISFTVSHCIRSARLCLVLLHFSLSSKLSYFFFFWLRLVRVCFVWSRLFKIKSKETKHKKTCLHYF